MTGQDTSWGIWLVNAPAAWPHADGDGVRVLIVDSGIDPHEDLPTIPSGNCGDGIWDGCDDGGPHGTPVAGILMARDNSIGVVGVAPGITGSNTYSWNACNPSTGNCHSDEVAAAIDWGIDQNVRVINMSQQGEDFDQGLSDNVSAAWNTGTIVMVSIAGNLSSFEVDPDTLAIYPGAFSQVIAVSGVKPDKSFADTSPCDWPGGSGKTASNWGDHVELAAPFWSRTTVGADGYVDESNGWCGTSLSAPFVAGAAALVWERNPGFSNTQVRAQLRSNAEPLGAAEYFGYGLVNAVPHFFQTSEFDPSSETGIDFEATKESEAEADHEVYGFDFRLRTTSAGDDNTATVDFYVADDQGQWSYADTRVVHTMFEGWNSQMEDLFLSDMGPNTKFGITLVESDPPGNVVEVDARWVVWFGGP